MHPGRSPSPSERTASYLFANFKSLSKFSYKGFSLLFASLLSPVFVQAQSKITVLDSSATVDFPSAINLHLSARSEVNITDIRLRYILEQDSLAQVTGEAFVSFVPATTVDISWTFDLVKVGGVPEEKELARLKRGVMLEDGRARVVSCSVLRQRRK
jgi:hypothetical protein